MKYQVIGLSPVAFFFWTPNGRKIGRKKNIKWSAMRVNMWAKSVWMKMHRGEDCVWVALQIDKSLVPSKNKLH